jgi:hypothetical protein
MLGTDAENGSRKKERIKHADILPFKLMSISFAVRFDHLSTECTQFRLHRDFLVNIIHASICFEQSVGGPMTIYIYGVERGNSLQRHSDSETHYMVRSLRTAAPLTYWSVTFA